MNRTLDQLVNQVAKLTPGKRRLFIRQLKAMGLIEAEDLLSDRNPLHIALAVPLQSFEENNSQKVRESDKPKPPRPADRPQLSDRRSPDIEHPVAGPAGKPSAVQPATPPSRGEKLNGPIQIVFDGGSRGNPGEGYGSYALDWPGNPREVVQLRFGDQATNNEAEYDTLIAALEAVRNRMVELQIELGSASLSIWGDSLLVCSQVRGEWKCKEPRLQARLKKVRKLLKGIGESELNHQPREKSVEILGH